MNTPATAIQIVLHPDTLDPGWAGFVRLPALNAADLRKVNADNVARLRAAGYYRVGSCFIETGAAGIDTARRALAAERYNTVLIGAEICLAATEIPLLEAIINTTHTLHPHSRIMIGHLSTRDNTRCRRLHSGAGAFHTACRELGPVYCGRVISSSDAKAAGILATVSMSSAVAGASDR